MVKRGAPSSSSAGLAGRSGARFFCRTDAGVERPLALRRFAVRATTGPGTVRTHLTLELAGPAEERVEAVLRLAVPRGAAVTGAVLWVAGHAMNGAFVERERAREIYRSIVAHRRDPALITWDGPGWVAVSIFPLEGGEARRFELEWVEPAATAGGSVQYRVPALADGPQILARPSLEVDGHVVAIAGREVVPIAPAPDDSAAVVVGRTPGEPFHQLLVRAPAAPGPPRFVLLAETSLAMTAADRVRQHAMIETVLGALGADARVTILSADWGTSSIADDVAPDEARRALARLDAVVSAGALHLERALDDAVARARKGAAGAVLFVGRGLDGFAGDALRGPLDELRGAGIRLSIIAATDVPPPLADAAALTGGEALAADDLDGGLAPLVDALRPRAARPVVVARGAGDWRPLETVTGQTVWLGRALEAPPSPPGAAVVASTDGADLLPLWDRARLVWTERALAAAPARTTSLALTPLRSLLVLESERDYARFGLVAAAAGRGRSHRGEEGKMGKVASREGAMGLRGSGEAPALPAARRAVEQSRVGSILKPESALGSDPQGVLGSLMGAELGANGFGLVGVGSGGSGTAEGLIGLGNLGTTGAPSDGDGSHGNGSGYGRGVGGLGGRRAQAPDVIPGQSIVRGSLDKEIIRRIIRRHINELRVCYDQGLIRKADLGGRLAVQLTIAPAGEVLAAVVQSSTLGDPNVEGCVVQAVRRWVFPRPPVPGIVIVSYPFVFTPGTPAWSATPEAHARAESARADRAVFDALVILAEKGTLASRVERIASRLGFDRTRDPETVAWTIDRSRASLPEITLVARLLAAADRPRDAVRVLSEWARAEPGVIAVELRHLKAEDDAAEVVALAQRRS